MSKKKPDRTVEDYLTDQLVSATAKLVRIERLRFQVRIGHLGIETFLVEVGRILDEKNTP